MLLLQGLGMIHGCGLIHGDIKPDNLRVKMRPNGSQLQLVIIDLGTCCPTGAGQSSFCCLPFICNMT